MTEENTPGSQAGGLPPASQKTKEQWLEEGKLLMFHAPIGYEEALAAFEEASHLEPNNASIRRHIGDVLLSQERPDEARQVYARAGQPGSREEA